MKCGRRFLGTLAVMLLLMSSLVQTIPNALAQNAPLTIVARGLTTPGGFTWNTNDILFIALTGSGGNQLVEPEAPAPLGPMATGETGAVAIVKDGCPTPLATGIVSTLTGQGRIYGAQSVAELDGQLYVLISNGGDQYGNHEQTAGVYRIGGDGSLNLLADHAAFVQENPPAVAPPEGFPNPGNPVAMISGNGALWIADQSNGLISKVIPGADELLVADLSSQGLAPTDLALGADGSIYASVVGQTATEPGSGGVVMISTDGDVEMIWAGLTMTSGVAFGNDGALYATELSAGATETAPFGSPNTGQLVRQNGDSLDVVADGLYFPSALATGPDGAVYFVTGALFSSDGTGTIARYAPDGSETKAAPANCAPIEETLNPNVARPTPEPAAPAAPPETPTPRNTPTATPLPTPTVPWIPDSAAPTGEVVEVGLSEYRIDMPTTLPIGPVTFLITNYGTLTHGFAIEGPRVDAALTHELEPGQSGAFTVDLQSGTYSVTSPTIGDRDNGMSLVLTVR